MATSSITHNFVIKGDAVERFANAIEASWNQEIPERPPVGRLVTDREEAWEILRKSVEHYKAKGILK